IWLTSLANFGGPRVTGQIGSVTVWGVIIPVAGLSVIGWFWFDPEIFRQAWNPNGIATSDAIAQSIPLTLWAFLGMESAAQNSDAVENPQRNVPLACLLGTLGAAVIYVLSTSVIMGIVPNAELANSSAPFAFVYAQMFNGWVGDIIMALAVMACVGSLLGWQFTLAQTAKVTAERQMFPRLFARVTLLGAPILGLIANAVLQTGMAVSTISPNASEQFGKLVNLAAVTNIIPYITALSALLIIMQKAGVARAIQYRNMVALALAMAYSFYALYASGTEAVFGGMIVTAVGYLLFGYIADRMLERRQALKGEVQ
ncbi:MAG TPA: putrescine-ornithine antiporter, partial [Pseudomonas sp.]|nr:putrescine-ornithine antiporter [Pseudomonas sp.]